MSKSYQLAQSALSDLRAAVHMILSESGDVGLRNVEIGKALGIYAGHIGHVGHIPRTVLGLMEADGTVVQDKETKRWTLCPVQNGDPESN